MVVFSATTWTLSLRAAAVTQTTNIDDDTCCHRQGNSLRDALRSDCSASGNQVDDRRRDRNYQQKMNETAGCVI
jgi:hypothetical protein